MDASIVLWTLIALPLAGAGLSLACRSVGAMLWLVRAGVLTLTAVAVVCACMVRDGGSLTTAWGWLYLDALSAYHVVVMTVVFSLSSLYLPGYFRAEIARGAFRAQDARRFGALWFGALTAMAVVLVSNNIGMLWVGLEATTLVTAFLICTHRTPASMEAMWKYLIICSVGIAFAFMGTLLAGAAANGLEPGQRLLWTHLRAHAAELNPALMKVAFLFLLVGYGTKAGLAPMHSWLPDAHSQAPAPVSAIFSGFMLNAALYCLMRYMPLVEGCTGQAGWSHGLMLAFGLISILVAAAFIVFQTDLKRLLAYCSVEHIGIIAVGLGLGGLGAFAALFHTLNHSLCKSLTFFAAGRLGQNYGSLTMSKMAGSLRDAPVWGRALFVGLLALIGVAPFAVFMSEFMVLRAAAQSGAFWTMGLFLAGVGVVFVGILKHAMQMAWGEAVETPQPERASGGDKALVAGMLGVLLVLGLWMPQMLRDLLNQAAIIVEGAR